MATITVGTNSWVTIAQADAYIDGIYGADAWSGLSNSVKTKLLITAFNTLRRNYDIAASSTSQVVKDAQCEMAWYLYVNNDEMKKRIALQSQGVKEFDIGNFSESFNGKAKEVPSYIDNLLEDFQNWEVVGTFSREVD